MRFIIAGLLALMAATAASAADTSHCQGITDTAARLACYDAASGSSSQISPLSGQGEFACRGKTKCGQMNSCAEARYYLEVCGVRRLDGDNDGTPCESLC